MRSRHPIYPQENVAIINSSSISNQNDEFDFLKVTLAKNTSGNFFAEGFSPPMPRRPTATGQMGMGDLILDKMETQVWQLELTKILNHRVKKCDLLKKITCIESVK